MKKKEKKHILEGFDAAAEGLGNTRAVCRSYYVHPRVVETYETGEICPYFKKVRDDKEPTYQELSETEKAILKLIQDYRIEIDEKINKTSSDCSRFSKFEYGLQHYCFTDC